MGRLIQKVDTLLGYNERRYIRVLILLTILSMKFELIFSGSLAKIGPVPTLYDSTVENFVGSLPYTRARRQNDDSDMVSDHYLRSKQTTKWLYVLFYNANNDTLRKPVIKYPHMIHIDRLPSLLTDPRFPEWEAHRCR